MRGVCGLDLAVVTLRLLAGTLHVPKAADVVEFYRGWSMQGNSVAIPIFLFFT